MTIQTAMSGTRKAAIVLLLLGEEVSSEVFKHLSEDEIETLAKEMAALGPVSSVVSERVMEEFHSTAIAAEYVTRGDVEYVRKDGRRIWVSYNGKAIDANDIAEGIIWVGQDITERKRAELLLREGKQQVEQALAEVERTQRQLAQLSELSGFLQACASASEAYACVAEYGPRLFPRARGALYLFDDSGALLVGKARWGDWPVSSAARDAEQTAWAA